MARQTLPAEAGPDSELRHRHAIGLGAVGHQLGLVVAATDPDMMLADETSSVTVPVRLASSSVTLPVVDGSAALRVEPTDRVPVVRAAQLPTPPAHTRRPH